MHSLRYHEKKQHGTIDFPVEYHYVDSAHPQYVMPFHWHKEWELIRILQGAFTIHADEEVIHASAGDVILLRDSMLHGGVPEDCIYECFLFDLHNLFRSSEMIKEHLRPVYRMHLLPTIFYPKDLYPTINQIAAAIMGCCTVAPAPEKKVRYNELMLVGCICNLFAWILQEKLYLPNQEPYPRNSHRIEQIKTVMEYIEQEFASPISLNDLANRAGMNPNYFCRIFKEIIRQTPIEYLMHYRIEQATALLTSSELSITEISLECGFNDYSYFIRLFKRMKGITPKQYQLQHTAHPALPPAG